MISSFLSSLIFATACFASFSAILVHLPLFLFTKSMFPKIGRVKPNNCLIGLLRGNLHIYIYIPIIVNAGS